MSYAPIKSIFEFLSYLYNVHITWILFVLAFGQDCFLQSKNHKKKR